MKRFHIAAAAAASMLLSSSVIAAPEATFEELLIGEEAYTQKQNELQLTTGIEYGEGDDVDFYRIPFKGEFGVTDQLQVDALLPYYKVDPEQGDSVDGFGDAEVGGKFALLQDINTLALTTAVRLQLPTGDEDEGLGDDTYRLKPAVIVARRLAQGEIHSGIEVTTGAGTDLRYFAAGVLPFERTRLLLEFDATDADGQQWHLMPGVLFKPVDSFEGGVGVPIGLSENTPDIGLILKGSFKFSA